jgi:very-short-patch-repair endonuclease
MSLPLYRVVLEYKGRHHVTDAEQYVRDIHRYERMQEHGWRVMRFTKEDLTDRPEETVRRIRRVLASRGWRPQPPQPPQPPRNC